MPELLTPLNIALLILTGLVAGCVNTLAGGGSMLTLPALMLVGLPADIANGTNRVHIVAQSAAASLGFRERGQLTTKNDLRLVLPTLLGALLGALVASRVPVSVLKPTLLLTMIVVAAVFAFKRNAFSAKDGGEEQPPSTVAYASLFVAGVYGGFVQAGVGFVLLAVLGGLLGQSAIRANALKVVCVFCFGLVALAVFVLADQVQWTAGLILAAASVVGARIGVRLAFRISPDALRWFVFACVVIVSVAAWYR